MNLDSSTGLSLNTASLTAANITADGTATKDPKRLADAAKQFESLMISQMMKTARETSGGWLSEGDETGEDSSMGMAEQQFAQSLASNGGLGLAKMIVKTMSPIESKTPTAAENMPLPPK